MRTEYDEECEQEEGEEKCRTEFDYVCEETKTTTYAPPTDSYGIPAARPLSTGTYGSAGYGPTPGSRIDETEDELPEYENEDELPEYRYVYWKI